MIGLALLFSAAAIVVAVLKRGRYRKQVALLAVLTLGIYLVTLHFTTQSDPQNPFAAIGPAILGSFAAVLVSVTALVLSFVKK